MKLQPTILKSTGLSGLIFLTILSTISLAIFVPPIKPAQASGNVNMELLTSGPNMPAIINATGTPQAVIKFNIYDDSATGILSSLYIHLGKINSGNEFDPNIALAPFDVAAASSGASLWLDSDSNGIFDAASDAAIATPYSLSWYPSGDLWYAGFSSINQALSSNYNNPTGIFLVLNAQQFSSSSEPYEFRVIAQANAMHFDNGSIASWPSSTQYREPVIISQQQHSPLLFSEIQFADNEFIELYNRSPENLSLDGWSIEYHASPSVNLEAGTVLHAFSTSSIQSGGFFLLGNGDIGTTTDVILPAASLGNSGGIITLKNPLEEIMDKVAYGAISHPELAEGGNPALISTASTSIERKAEPDSTYQKMIAGGIHHLSGNSYDSDNNQNDFIVRTSPEPQYSSSTPEYPQSSQDIADYILINEVFYNTGTTTRWIELFNPTGSPVDIQDYTIKHKGWSETIDISTTIASHGFLLIHWNQTGTNDSQHYYTGLISEYADLGINGGDIILRTSDFTVADYMQYGGSNFANESLAVAYGEWSDDEYVPNCLYGQALGRKSIEGYDYNESSDWQTFSQATPLSPNNGGDAVAPSAVTNVVLSDIDTANYGLNGSDLQIVWTPDQLADDTFARYEIYLLPDGTNLDVNIHRPVESIYYQYQGATTTLFSYFGSGYERDSAGNFFASGYYRAYILVFDNSNNKSAIAASPSALLEEDNTGEDNTCPYISHIPVGIAPGGIDLHLIVRADDDRQMAAVNPVQLRYETGTSSNFDLSILHDNANCTALIENWYDCTIPNGSWSNSDYIGYYFMAQDANGNISYRSASPEADAAKVEQGVMENPFIIDIESQYEDLGAEPDLAGHIYRTDGNPLATTTIFLQGTANGYQTTNAEGYFAFPDNSLNLGGYFLMAVKEGYYYSSKNVFHGTQDIGLYLNEGYSYFSSEAENGNNPIVKWTAPGDGSTEAPIDIYCTSDCSAIGANETPIIVAFDRPMSANTINDQNAADAGSNIYLTTDGNDRVNGKVYYNSAANEARFYAAATNTLALGTHYNIVVTQGVTDEAGNPIIGDNSDGSFSSGFTTRISTITTYDNFGTGGANMAPYIISRTPAPGAFYVARNASIVLEFNTTMDFSSINSSSIVLRPVTDNAAWSYGEPVSATVTLDQATRKIATLDPSADMSAAYSWWVVQVKGSVKSSAGMYMLDPTYANLNTDNAEEFSFQINTGATDSTQPQVKGTYPNNNDGITSSATAVNVGIGALIAGFSEAMDPATINSANVKLLAGSSLVSGKVTYDSASYSAKFTPYNALLPNTQYTFRIADCTDLAGNSLIATSTVYFKTGSADTTAPELMYANGDDYSLAITFSEPMNAAKQTDTANWPYSVLNPANYYLNGINSDECPDYVSWSCATTRQSPYNTDGGTNLSGQGLAFTYDDYSSTVYIDGLAFGLTTDNFQIFVDNVKDKSNNTIADSGNRSSNLSHLNAARAPLYNSADTYGILGPGEYDYTMDMSDLGMMKASIAPINAIAGQQSAYYVRIPTTKTIPIGGKIILTFPAGFDIANAVRDPYSTANSDINEWNSGKVEIHSITGNQTNRTITIIATTSATQTLDYLRLDIKGIVNSSIPKDYNTEGYLVDIKTFTPDGALLETIYTMPFYLNEGGSRSISGNIDGLALGDNGTMTVYLGSPMTGPMETLVSVAGTGDANPDGSYLFSNLPDGEYYIYTNPNISINGNDYFGNASPDPIWLNGANGIKNLSLTPASSGGAALTVTLTGNFSSDGIADDVDIFASSPNGFRVKTLYDVGSTTNTSATLYLSEGDWMVGIGPAAPAGGVYSTIKMPDWMPPSNVYYRSDGATPGNLAFNIASQTNYTVSGSVVDNNGAGIADAEVWAYQPMGAYGGAFTKTATDGTFVLKIPVLGTYNIGAYKPGLPEPKEKALVVDGNESGLVFVITRPDYTISGKVLNSSGSAIANAPVWAWQENSWGHASAMTDAAGNYILFVNPGTWHVETDAPGIGWQAYERALTITNASMPNINISPSLTASYYTISGKVGIDNNGDYSSLETPLANMPIRAVKYDASGVYQGREFNGLTNSLGEYSLTVSAGIYRVDIWTQEYGEIGINNINGNNALYEAGDDDYANNPANVNALSANAENYDIVIPQNDLNTVSLTFTNAQSQQAGYLNIEGVNESLEPTGLKMFKRFTDLSQAQSVKLQDGNYFMSIDIPGLGNFMPGNDYITVDTATTVNFTLPDADSEMVTITGTVYSGSAQAGNELRDAWVWINNPSSGYHNGTQTNANGAYSLNIPSGDTYRIGAGKPGYMSDEPAGFTATASGTRNLVLAEYNETISGRIYYDANSNGSYDPGESLPNGFVRAQTVGCLDNDEATACQKAHTPVDGTGYYELGLVAGTWKIYGMADGYSETEFTSNISALPAANINIKLLADSAWTTKSKLKQITPSSGGSLDDTAPGGTGIKLVIPPNALGNGTAAGNVNAKKTSAVTATDSSNPLGRTGINVTATDNSGQAFTNLDDYIDVEIVLYKADIISAIASGDLSTSSLKNINNGYWDSTANDWVNITTTPKAYYKATALDTNWVLYADTATSVPAFHSFINKLVSGAINPYDYKLVFTSKTNHLTIFAVVMPFVVSIVQSDPEPEPDPDPAPLPSGGGGGSSVSYCQSVEYGEWSSCVDGFQNREVTSKTPNSCRLTTIQEQEKTRACLIQEEAEIAENNQAEPTAALTGELSTDSIDQLYLDQAAFVVRADISEILPALKRERDHQAEQKARELLIGKMQIALSGLEAKHQYALTNFIAYGSPDTLKLGSGERAGVINSYLAAFGKLPKTENDWSDLIKIANGRWPATLSETAEKKASDIFINIYKKIPDRSNPFDDAAVTVIAYGLRPANRNTDSEAAAIKIFKAIYNYHPGSATDWDIVRAIAYSGAVRSPDKDGDLLIDEREAIFGTDPNNKDSDNDGYTDGEEVRFGYDPLS